MGVPVPRVAGDGAPARAPVYRYERKFLVEGLLPAQVAGIVRLHPRLFYEPYPPRYVNNLYLDTPDLENYYDHINGATRRRKVRIRWYGAPLGPIGRPAAEFKIKDGLVGTKVAYDLAPFSLQRGFSRRDYLALLDASDLPPEVRRDLRDLQVVLLNRYYRRYYASRDGCFRITLDTELTYYRANNALENALLHRQVNNRQLVVELKYDVSQEPQADRVAGYLPFPVARSSKYIEGIERVYF
jgi:hypothetical protein